MGNAAKCFFEFVSVACSGGPPPGFESDGFLTDADVVYKKFEAKIATLKGTLDRQVANR